MKTTHWKLTTVALALGLLGASGAAQASLSWALNSGNDDNATPPTFNEAGGGYKVTISGWTENENDGDKLIDVSNRLSLSADRIILDQVGEDPPNHAFDNDATGGNKGREMALAVFEQSTILTMVDWAYTLESTGSNGTGSTSNRLDFEVWYYDGAGTPDVAGKTYGGLLLDGWKILGEYNDVGTGDYLLGNAEKESTHWIVMTALDGGNNKEFDYGKLRELGGEKGGGGGPQVPVPAPLLLMGLGLPLIRLARRSR